MIICIRCDKPATKLVTYKTTEVPVGITGASYCNEHYSRDEEMLTSEQLDHFDGVSMVLVS